MSVVLGKMLFGERIALADHLPPATLGACLVAAGTVVLSLSPAVASHWDATRTTEHSRPDRLPTAADDEGTEAR